MKSVQLEAWLAHRKASEPQFLPHEEAEWRVLRRPGLLWVKVPPVPAYGKPRPEEGNSRLPGRGKVKFTAQ